MKSELAHASSLFMLLPLKVSSKVTAAPRTPACALHQLRTATQKKVCAVPSAVAEPTASAHPV